jgi:hypothetical protein
LNQEFINHLNIYITSHKIEAVIESLPTKKNPGLDVLMMNSTRSKELTSMFLKLLIKIEMKVVLSNSFNEANIILIQNKDEVTSQKRKL